MTGWVVALFRDPEPVEVVRDEIFEEIGNPSVYTREWLPHLSFFGATIPEGRADAFTRQLADVVDPLVGSTIDVDGFYLYPDQKNPMVVGLDPAVTIDEIRSKARTVLTQCGGTVTKGPYPPHITLFRGGGCGEESMWGPLPRQVQGRLRRTLRRRDPTFTLAVRAVRLLRTDDYMAAQEQRNPSPVSRN
jgi:2'-5' RNA ligase